jgi:hypothetical protein
MSFKLQWKYHKLSCIIRSYDVHYVNLFAMENKLTMTQNVFPWLQTIRLHDFTLKATLSVHPSSMSGTVEEWNARSATHFIWCPHWLPPPHLAWPSRRPLPYCLLPAPLIMLPVRTDTMFFMHLPTSATEWWIGDRLVISGALMPV